MYLGYANWSAYSHYAARSRYPYSGAPVVIQGPNPNSTFRYSSYWPKTMHGVQLAEGGQKSQAEGEAAGAVIGAMFGSPQAGAAIGSMVGSLVGGKASDFREWIYFDNQAHFLRTEGDKPNATTIGMANAIQNAMQQYISTMEAQGTQFVLPSDFVITIGTRDPSYLYMPSNKKGDPGKGSANSVATLSGPGNPQGVVTSLVGFLAQYKQSKQVTPSPGSATSIAPYTGPAAPALIAPQFQTPQYYAPQPMPQFQPGPTMMPYAPAPSNISITTPGAQTADMFGGATLQGMMPYILGGVGLFAILMMQNKGGGSQPRRR
jgi:hypothetical protein